VIAGSGSIKVSHVKRSTHENELKDNHLGNYANVPASSKMTTSQNCPVCSCNTSPETEKSTEAIAAPPSDQLLLSSREDVDRSKVIDSASASSEEISRSQKMMTFDD